MTINNQSAFLDGVGVALRVGDSPMPTPGPDQIVIRNHAVAINPIDYKMQASGKFIRSYPIVLGQNVAGEVHEVGSDVRKFKAGDRVVGHPWGTMNGKLDQGAFNLYSVVPARNTAKVPDKITLTEASVLPLPIDTAICGLFRDEYMALPGPSLTPSKTHKTIVVYGGSSSVGCMATQLATAAGVRVVTLASKQNHELCLSCGATDVFDYHDLDVVKKVVEAVGSDNFIGIYDAIGEPSCYAHDLAILEKLGGGFLASVFPPPEKLPENVKAKHVFGMGEWAFPIWDDFITPALESGLLKCLPEPLVVGKGLESVQAGFDKLKAGVSARKVVVEL
ncbi:hypothetical protein LTR49_003171 [Elasticomyces elasticus]|nr:hypothetical protein LTR49_003171 [Elasticomyces elasticus]